MTGTTWMGVDKVVDVDDLTTEEMFLTKVEAEVIVGALRESEHGIIAVAAEAVAEVGAGVGAGAVVEAAAGLVVVVAAIAVVLVRGVVAVVAAVEVTVVAAVAAPVMVGVIGQINHFLIKVTLGLRK